MRQQPERFKLGSIPNPALLSVNFIHLYFEVHMVQLDRKEIVDFLNEKADVITNFVQAQEELSNVENVWFSVEEIKHPNEDSRLQAYCYIEFNEFNQSYSSKNMQWVFRNLGIWIFSLPDDMGKNLLRFAVTSIVAQPVVVRRNYDVLVAESAIRLLEDEDYKETFGYTITDPYLIDENFEKYVSETSAEISKEQGYSDLLYGGEFDADLSPSYGVF